MPTIVFEPGPQRGPQTVVRAPLVVEVPQGGALVDVCDTNTAPIPFACKSANCGTCRIDVLEGLNLLVPAADDELDLLDILGATPVQRLACQVKMNPGPGRVRVRAIDDGF